MMDKELTKLFIHITESRYVKSISSKMSLTKIDINKDCYIITYSLDDCPYPVHKQLSISKKDLWTDIILFDIWKTIQSTILKIIDKNNIQQCSLYAGEKQLQYNIILDKNTNEGTVFTIGAVNYEQLEDIILETSKNNPTVVQIIKEREMNPYVQCNTLTWGDCACETAITTNKPVLWETKTSHIKFQSLIKNELNIDTKFINRLFKKISNTVVIGNYENNDTLEFGTILDGIENKYYTEVKEEETHLIYRYIISNNKEFKEWVNSLNTENYEDRVNATKVTPDFNVKQIVYYVREAATIDDRIFNELWDILTPEQRTEYLFNNIAKQNLVRKGVITSVNCYINTKDVDYNIFDFSSTGMANKVAEDKIFTTSEEAIHYLINEFANKNKKD